MTISFPNLARSYDPRRRRVRFWAHDEALEITFFVDADALAPPAPGSPDDVEAAVLKAFDDGRDRVHQVAASMYSRARGYTYSLTAVDF